MVDIAQLGIDVDSRDVASASDDLDDFTASGARADGQTQNLTRSTKGLSAVMSSAKVAVAGMIAGFASFQTIRTAARYTLDYGSALREVGTLLPNAVSGMAGIDGAARRLAKTYGGDAVGQVNAFYQAISAGAGSVAEATEILDVANRLAIGGVTDVTTGVDALTTAVNAYGPSVLSAEQASDALFVGMRAGKTTVAELGRQLGNVLPIASSLGVSFDEAVAATAALTTQGLTTAQSVTGLRAALTSITGPTKQASDLAKSLGLEFNTTALRSKGLQGFLQEVIDKTGGSADAMRALFGSVEATTAVLALAGGGSQALNDILADMAEKAGATASAFELMAGDKMQRLNVQLAFFRDGFISIGSVALAVLIPGLEGLSATLTFLADNIGYVVGGLTGLSATVLPAAIAGVSSLATAIYGAVTATYAQVAALVTLRGAILATGVGALVIGLAYLGQQFVELVRRAGSFGNALKLLKDVAVEVWDRIRRGGSLLQEGLAFAAQGIKGEFLSAFASIAEGFASLTQGVADGWNALFGTNLVGAGSGFASEIRAQANADMESAAKGLKSIGDTFAELKEEPFEALKSLEDITEEAADAETGVDALTSALNDLNETGAGLGGGSGSGSAASGVKRVSDEISEATRRAQEFHDAGQSAFRGLVKGTLSFRDALGQVIDKLADMAIDNAFNSLFSAPSSGGGGFLSTLLGGLFSFDGGGHTGYGPRSGGLDGKGGFLAMMHPQETVVDHTKGQVAGGTVDVRVYVEQDGNWQAAVENAAGPVAARVVSDGLRAYDRGLPNRVKQIQNDPRRSN